MTLDELEAAYKAFAETAEKRSRIDRLVVHPEVYFSLSEQLANRSRPWEYQTRIGGLTLEPNQWIPENRALAFVGNDCVGILELGAPPQEGERDE